METKSLTEKEPTTAIVNFEKSLVAIQAETAQTRLDYFADVKGWCDKYLALAKTKEMDSVVIDQDLVKSIQSLRTRLIKLIVKDAIEVAKHEINGNLTWQNFPQL